MLIKVGLPKKKGNVKTEKGEGKDGGVQRVDIFVTGSDAFSLFLVPSDRDEIKHGDRRCRAARISKLKLTPAVVCHGWILLSVSIPWWEFLNESKGSG